jgi:hypothetical protein
MSGPVHDVFPPLGRGSSESRKDGGLIESNHAEPEGRQQQ